MIARIKLLVECVRVLGFSEGIAYWLIILICQKDPAIEWAKLCELESGKCKQRQQHSDLIKTLPTTKIEVVLVGRKYCNGKRFSEKYTIKIQGQKKAISEPSRLQLCLDNIVALSDIPSDLLDLVQFRRVSCEMEGVHE